jgi:ribonuclease R
VFTEPICVDDVGAKGGKLKDKVVVEIVTYPTADYYGRGVLIEVLGKSGRYEAEILSVIRQFHLAGDFDEDCVKEAHKVSADFTGEVEGREELTGKTIITIDPVTAKDFDDAISIERDGEGNWVLGVHIADVSNFVKVGSDLDAEAKIRGNSAYLPGKTIPMLPEVLSNGVCSLQEGQKRFCKSAFITYDAIGRILGRRFANTVICSAKRLTYRQAEKILKGHTKDFEPAVVTLLGEMEELSRAIEGRRRDEGMIHLELPDTEVIMDKSGRVVDAEPADDSYPHTIIEMFMVEANEAAASLIDGLNIPFLRRVHPEPDGLAMKKLSKIVKTMGFTLPRSPSHGDIQKLLAAASGTESSLAINLLVLRSFQKAEYAPLHIGHYALASKKYCHFTSPIRRYADLLVHRVLESHIRGKKGKALVSEKQLVEIGKHITFTEQQAENAEGELKSVLILQLLAGRIGKVIDCVVTGVTNFGVFVQCKKFGIEGLIEVDDLGPDSWQFNPKGQVMAGLNSGVAIRLGQGMKAKIVAVNPAARHLKLAPAEPLVKKSSVKREKGQGRKGGRRGRRNRR